MGKDSPYIKRTLVDQPRVDGITIPADAVVTVAAEPIAISAVVRFSDGRNEECRGWATAWTTEAVYVQLRAAEGQYVTWLPAGQVQRRSVGRSNRTDDLTSAGSSSVASAE